MSHSVRYLSVPLWMIVAHTAETRVASVAYYVIAVALAFYALAAFLEDES